MLHFSKTTGSRVGASDRQQVAAGVPVGSVLSFSVAAIPPPSEASVTIWEGRGGGTQHTFDMCLYNIGRECP